MLVDDYKELLHEDFLNFLENNINYHNSISFKEEGVSKDKKKYELANKLFKNPHEFKFEKIKFKEILKQILTGILSGSLLLKARRNEETIRKSEGKSKGYD